MQKVVSPGESVEGADKIFSFGSAVQERDTDTLSGGSEVALTGAVPSGKTWVITHVSIRNGNRAATSYEWGIYDGATHYPLLFDSDGAAIGVFAPLSCELYLNAGDKLFCTVGGGQDNDVITLVFNGYQMNAP